ncbi:hypothetical protein [Sorangium sp. So ce590]|uniref:hypothetical protein n=1 Tax=unclassified Sorangium TaxID=2621164 RepID=UPI003F628689
MDDGRCEGEEATVRREVHAGWLAMSLLLGSTAATTSARGEERAAAGSNEESERDRAVRDFEEGRTAQLAGRLEEAELLYLRAWRRMKSYDIATNLGQVQLLLQKPASAAKHVAYGVRTVGPEVEPERVARMEALLAEAKAQVGTLRVRVTNVAGAAVFLDGQRVPEEEAKHEIYVAPGPHVLVLRHAGYEEAVIPVAAVAGSREEITTELKPKAAEVTGPGAAASGAASAPGMGGAKTKAPAAGARVEERSWMPVIALGAVSVVGLGVGVGFTVASRNASADVDAQGHAILTAGGQCNEPPSTFATECSGLYEAGSREETFGRVAWAAYAASGALAIAATTYALWPRPRRPMGTGVRVSPQVSAHGAGLALFGAW